MKKMMIALAALSLAGAAQAAANYHYNYSVGVSRYSEKDEEGSVDHAGWYSAYGMTQATARELLGTSDAVGYNAVATWLGNNFAANSAAVAANAQALNKFEYYGNDGLYYFDSQDEVDGEFWEYDDYIGVVLFNNGNEDGLAYKVMGAPSAGAYYFDLQENGSSAYRAPSTDWIPVSNDVPEPTSGLLMLLGMAGLALRRKRA